MQLGIGTVMGGKILVEGEPLPEGSVVTILVREGNEFFDVPAELEADLSESIAEAGRGEVISADDLLRRLRRRRLRATQTFVACIYRESGTTSNTTQAQKR